MKRSKLKTTPCGNCGTFMRYSDSDVLPPRHPSEYPYVVCGCGWLSAVRPEGFQDLSPTGRPA